MWPNSKRARDPQDDRDARPPRRTYPPSSENGHEGCPSGILKENYSPRTYTPSASQSSAAPLSTPAALYSHHNHSRSHSQDWNQHQQSPSVASTLTVPERPIHCDIDGGEHSALSPTRQYRDSGLMIPSPASSAEISGRGTPDTDMGNQSPSSSNSTAPQQFSFSLVTLDNPQIKLDYNDDVKIDQEICYGMILAQAQLLPPESTDTLELHSITTNNLANFTAKSKIFKIRFWEEGCYTLLSSNEEPIAVIDTCTTAILEDLDSRNFMPSLRYQAYIHVQDTVIHTTPGESKSGPTNILAIHIIIYGVRSIMDHVGSAMTIMKAYLQQPTYKDPGIEYDNPHYFKPRGQKTPWVEISDGNDEGVNPCGEISLISQIKAGVLECRLTRSEGLTERKVDARITTELVRHQKEALDFIAHRESGATLDAYSLWRLVEQNGTPRFHNLIDGSQCIDNPSEFRCGIIADEMGLGKTLTMISAIVGSLEEAAHFANSNPNGTATSLTNTKLYVKSTLIILPVALLSQWVEEIEKHTVKNSLKVHRYHGKSKIDVISLSEYDIVVTTYAKVVSEFKSQGCSQLYDRVWFRIVLDEAHEIRNTQCKQFRAISFLSAQRRWCLTGTPIHNSLDDIAALFQFMQVSPVNTRSLFRRHVIDPMKVEASSFESTVRIHNLHLILTTYCLRRKQSILRQSIHPGLTETVRRLEWSPVEYQGYVRTQIECKRAIEKAVCTLGKQSSFSTFQAIMRLRLFCNHGVFCLPMESGNDSTCAFCMGQIDIFLDPAISLNRITLECGHLVCASCASVQQSGAMESTSTLLETKPSQLECLVCEQHSKLNNVENHRHGGDALHHLQNCDEKLKSFRGPYHDGHQYSTKIAALLEDLQNNPQHEKSIVFSCWLRTLKHVEHALRSHKMSYVLIDGRLSLEDRMKTLKKFFEDPHIMVLLMTTGTGAVGLNLTVASRVHLLEPQWNPMVETQAIGRVARLGQTRPIAVYRYIMASTIEENIRTLQSNKMALAGIALDTRDIH